MKPFSTVNVSNRGTWAGWALTGVVSLVLLTSGIAKMAGAPPMVDGLIRAGIPQAAILPIAILELTCLALYLHRRTAVLGSFLLTGFFGGAAVTHIIGRENFVPPLMIGLLVWASVWFRVPEIRDLLPFRRSEEGMDAYQAAASDHPLPSRG